MISNSEGGALVSQLHQLSSRVFGKIMRDAGLRELNPAQGRIIFALWKDGDMSLTELSGKTRLDKSTLTLMLDRLEKDGHIERIRDTRDARRKIIRCTEQNRALHRLYGEVSEKMTTLFYEGFSDADIASFEDMLRKIITNLAHAGHGQL